MIERRPRWYFLLVFLLLYPALAIVVRFLPNPMVPDAVIALNMIAPVLAGFLFGPVSGVICGGGGTALSALLHGSMYDVLAVCPHALMGAAAGFLGRKGSEFQSSLAIILGHGLNILFFYRFGMLSLSRDSAGQFLLGLASETTVDIVIILLVAKFLKPRLFCTQRL